MELKRGREDQALGQDSGFNEFAERAMPKLLKAAYLLTRDNDVVEDVVQGALLRVFRNWDRAREAPDAYSQHALISVCRDYWRRKRRRPRETSLDSAPVVVGVEFSEELAERDALEQGLQALSQHQREVIVLRYYFDLSVSDTATLLGIAEGTVKSTASRALQEMRTLMSAADEGR